jgi:ribulose-5-phosphate 4-epimerase/fuculose-1-phosphate aldolase
LSGLASSTELATVQADLVLANHILAHHQVVDAFGHVSVRHPIMENHYLISRSMAPAAVGLADLMGIGEAGEPVSGERRRPFLERFIHSAIYRARPDIGAIVHSHSHAVIPFGVVREAPLRPIFHMAGFIGSRAPIFEIRDVLGDTSDMLIRTPELGSALAECLGDSAAVVLMRGHGSTCAGADLRQAVFRAIYLEINARIQISAHQLGNPLFLSAAEAANADASTLGQIERAWALWCAEVTRTGT